MGVTTRRSLVSVSLNDLESLVRRVIREELARQRQLDILDDWSHEGPDDPGGDEHLLRDALVASQEYRASQEGWLSWEECEAEIERAEAAGEYRIEVRPSAQKEILALPGYVRAQARQMIRAIGENPRSSRALELRERPNIYRIWLAGRWRIVYEVDDDLEVVLILRIRAKETIDYDGL